MTRQPGSSSSAQRGSRGIRISDRFEHLITASGLPPARPYDLRHCAATYLSHAGADLKEFQAAFGHSTIRLTSDTYICFARGRDLRPTNRWPALRDPGPQSGNDQAETEAHWPAWRP